MLGILLSVGLLMFLTRISMKWLRLGYWNIYDVYKDGVPKTDDCVVNKILCSHDIFCLSEIHCSDENVPMVEGYGCFKKCRGKSKKINRYFGGIAIYYRKSLRPGIKFIKDETDYVWLKLCKSFFGMVKDVYLCLSYIPPEYDNYYKSRGIDSISMIEEDVVSFMNLGSVMLMGDFNARTGDSLDYIESDDFIGVDESWYEPDVMALSRTSCDLASPCARGKRLLDLCRSTRIRILNGRSLGDSFGSFTCYKDKGSSVVDYVILSEDAVKDVAFFHVGDFYGSISDHCYVSSALRVNSTIQIVNKESSMPFPSRFLWDERNIFDFQLAFNQDVISNMFTNVMDENVSIDSMISKINDIYYNVAGRTLKKAVHKRNKKKTVKRWFDKSLYSLKSHVCYLSRLLQMYPNDPQVRGSFFRGLKFYNKERKRKRRQFKQNLLNKLDDLKENNPKGYWKLLESLKEIKDDAVNIDMEEWRGYFMDLSSRDSMLDKRRILIESKLKELEDVKCFNELNFRISEKELLNGIKKLKNNKAVGLDGISNEMIKYSQHAMHKCLLKVFNCILCDGFYPSCWGSGYIVPLFKGGDKSLPVNYRGITVMSCLAKLFNTILNDRLDKFLEDREAIDCRQIGFKKKARTSDHVFVLRSLIDKYARKSSKLFASFIDFRKAYDKVDHVFLIFKLMRSGIGGNFIKLLKDSYLIKGFDVSIKVNNMLSRPFKSASGVRQGDPLSCNLFKLFINDLPSYINCNEDPPMLGDLRLGYLMYADDIILLAKSEDELQKAVKGVEKFCDDWGLDVNTKKSKIIVFNSKGVVVNTNILYKGFKLEDVNTYRYLGIMFHVSGKPIHAKQDLLSRGLKALFKLLGYFKQGKPSVSTGFHLFDMIVKPVLLYGADVYGYNISKCHSIYNELFKDVFEKCHMKFCRYILGVNRHASLSALYGETGRFPLYISSIRLFVKYWFRLHKCTEKSNKLLHYAFEYNINSSSCWSKSIQKLCKCMNIDYSQLGRISMRSVVDKVTDFFKKEFIQGWKTDLYNDKRKDSDMKNKLRCYRNFKNEFYPEYYLFNCSNPVFRSNICRLRISCHKLHIETGRYVIKGTRLRPEERLCIYCNLNMVEDECHFLLSCPLYKEERKHLLLKLQNTYKEFEDLDEENKFRLIMSTKDKSVISALGYYVTSCFKKRSTAIAITS